MGKASRNKRTQRAPVIDREPAAVAALPARQTALICGALVVLVLLVFGRTVLNDAIAFDDPPYVTANPVVQRGLTGAGLAYAFTTLQPYYWQPVTWISLELDSTLFGGGAGARHLVSVVLHAMTAALLFLFLQRASGRIVPSAAAAALWAVHPLRVESVAWIAERKDVLSGLFFVAALLAYERFVRQRTIGRYALVLAMFALALMSKPTVVTAALVFVLLNWWPFGRLERERRRVLAEAAGPAVLAVPIIVLTVVGQQQGIDSLPFSLRLTNAARSAGVYLGKLLLPIDLSIVYPFRKDIAVQAVVSAAVVVAISYVVWTMRRSRPALVTGWGWYLSMLLPVIGLVQSGAQAMADRFTYIPSMGIAIAAVWLVAAWRTAARVIAVPAIVAFAAVSFWYAGLWRDTITLFSHATAVTQENSLAHIVLGNAYLAAGRMDEANAAYAAGAEEGHGAPVPLAAYGAALLQQKRYVEAVEPLQRAVDADPNIAGAHADLATALIRAGRPAAALPHIDTAQRLDPSRSLDLTTSRGEAKLALGRIDEALADFQQVARARPSSESWNNVGRAYASKDDFAGAERAYRESIRLEPKNYDARMNFAAMLSRAGRSDEGIAQVREAARLTPESVEPRVYLALMEAQLGRHADAANDAAEAQRIDAAKANEAITGALRLPPKDTNLADFIAAMRAR